MGYQKPLTDLIPIIAYDADDKLFYGADHSLSFGFICQGLPGGDERIEQRLRALLGEGWPDDSILQISLVSSPNLFREFEDARQLREGKATGVLREVIRSRIDYLSGAVDSSFAGQSGLMLRRFDVFVIGKIRARGTPIEQEELLEAGKLRFRVEHALRGCGLAPRVIDQHGFVQHLGAIVNRSGAGAWRVFGGDAARDDLELREQVFDRGTDLRVERDGLFLDDVRVSVLSPKTYPRSLPFGLAAYYVGDPVNGSRGLRGAFMVTLNVFFPSPQKAVANIGTKRNYLVSQASGPIAKWLPHISKRSKDMETLLASVEAGHRVARAALTVVLFSAASGTKGKFERRCEDAMIRAEADQTGATAFWAESMFTLMRDRFIVLPAFVNALPFCADVESVRDLGRYRTMTTQHVGRLAPIFSDWPGTGTGSLNLVSRNGALMNLCLFDSGTNYNATIAAESGSGKSFLANEIIASYLSQGAAIWVIDVGRSYANLSEMLEGTYVDVGDSGICFNPFPLIKDYEEEADILEAVVAAMASPTEVLTDVQRSELSKTMRDLFGEIGTAMTIDDIARKMLSSEDERVRDVGTRLYSCTSAGQYGRFFNGPNTVSFSGSFTVLELENLRTRKHLQRIVLLMLIYVIQQEMFQGDPARKKLVLIDEAWDLLTDGEVGKFIEAGYRRFRKYNGAAITITQSMADYSTSATGHAIAVNSANSFLLGQKPETIDQLRAKGGFALTDFACEVLKTVHTVPGSYSEVYVRTDRGEGVGRLIVSEFNRLIYSPRPVDKVAITRFRDGGLSMVDAINAVLDERARRQPAGRESVDA